MRVPVTITPSLGLLWILAFLVAGVLAYWDHTQSSSDRAGSQQSMGAADPEVPQEVEIEVIYGD